MGNERSAVITDTFYTSLFGTNIPPTLDFNHNLFQVLILFHISVSLQGLNSFYVFQKNAMLFLALTAGCSPTCINW